VKSSKLWEKTEMAKKLLKIINWVRFRGRTRREMWSGLLKKKKHVRLWYIRIKSSRICHSINLLFNERSWNGCCCNRIWGNLSVKAVLSILSSVKSSPVKYFCMFVFTKDEFDETRKEYIKFHTRFRWYRFSKKKKKNSKSIVCLVNSSCYRT
jgi:hypothetical protein